MRARQEPPGRDIAVAPASAGGVDGGAIERGQRGDDVEQERAWLAAIVEQMPGGLVIASAPDGRVRPVFRAGSVWVRAWMWLALYAPGPTLVRA